MLPDMLGVPVPESIMAAKPADAKLRPPSPNTMDTDGKDKSSVSGNSRRRSGGGRRRSGGKGDRKSGRHGMDTEEQGDETKSPVYKVVSEHSQPGDKQQQNGDGGGKSEEVKSAADCMDGVG